MWTATAPSNIALIKYMGKQKNNVPCNVSLSFTLDEFVTEVKLEQVQNEDRFVDDNLSESEKKRFLNHLKYVKEIANFDGFFLVHSKNSFPKSAGIASSASSFAALTLCVFKAISAIRGVALPSLGYMSAISRVGSGSSCRSFFSPWCIWQGENAEKIDIPIAVDHEIILIDASKKEVSSSEAHRRVQTSLLMGERAERAESRCKKLISAFRTNRWDYAYQICWEEFWDMHALFETSQPHFGYMTPETLNVLAKVRKFWKDHNDGPIATVDAGPNVHLLWRRDKAELQSRFSAENSFLKLRKIS